MKKVIRETLQQNGKWSIKRIAGFSSFYFGCAYAFIPIFLPKFIVHEFVFWGFMTFSGSALLGTILEKKRISENIEN